MSYISKLFDIIKTTGSYFNSVYNPRATCMAHVTCTFVIVSSVQSQSFLVFTAVPMAMVVSLCAATCQHGHQHHSCSMVHYVSRWAHPGAAQTGLSEALSPSASALPFQFPLRLLAATCCEKGRCPPSRACAGLRQGCQGAQPTSNN